MVVVKKIPLNRPQAILHAVNANKCYVLWGRGTGKSNGGLGPRIVHLFNQMPGALIGFVVPTLEMATRQILPNIAGFWQNIMGLVEGENYVIGVKPPDHWPKPIQPVFSYKNVISFDNGCALVLLSLAITGCGNGFNLQALVGDEAKFFDETKLKEIRRALRGCRKEFGHLPEYRSEWYFSDKFDGNIQWMLDKRKLVNDKVIKATIRVQMELDKLTREKGPVERINKLTDLLASIRRRLVFVSEASAYENEELLGKEFFEDQKQGSTELEFKVAIKNEDPDKVENSFYPGLAESHYYNSTADVDITLPLIIAADYQWRISPIVQAQYRQLPWMDKLSLNFNYSCYSLHPKDLEDAINEWAFHNRYHSNRTVYYVFDKTATERRSTSRQAYTIMEERLQYHNWNVVLINCGEPPKHHVKFNNINKKLKGETEGCPVLINALRNQAMIRSINLTPAKTMGGKTAKDKSSEKNLSIPAQDSTHHGDVFDMILYADELELIPKSEATTGFGILLM